ncbi:MAG: PAS domain S-box protein [Deltaproteobacteria bacterium]|nr:PAS domain S-box protein [Deltaproteobacteria bacterium]
MQSLVATLASSFINVAPEQLDAAVCETLEAVGLFAGADRAVLAVFDETDTSWKVSHEWFGGGLLPLKEQMPEIPALPWTVAQFRAHCAIRIRSGVDQDPEPGQPEIELLEALGLHAVMATPVFVDGKLVGAAAVGAAAAADIAWARDLAALLELPGRIMLDALARRDSERVRRGNEALWRSFCDCEVIGVFILDRNGRLLESNDTGLRVIGRSREELACGAIEWESATPREYRSLDLFAVERLDRGGVVLPWEKEVQRPDGSRIPVLATLASMAPRAPELLALCIDLSERERAQRELLRSNRFDRLLTSLSRRLITLPAEAIDDEISGALAEVGNFFDLGRIGLFETTGNADVEELRLGWLAEPSQRVPRHMARLELASLPWWRERLRAGRAMYLPTLDSLPPEAAAERAMLAGNGVKGFLAIPLYPGRVSHGAIHFAAFHPLDLSDQHLALLRVFCDIIASARERKRAEEELRTAGDALERRVHERRAQLEASNAELEAFAYSVSHDLRAPLRTIDGLSHALLEDFPAEFDQDARALVRRMTQATARMSDLIDGLLQLSRVVRTAVEWNPVDLSAVVGDLATEQRTADPGRTVAFDIAPGIVARGHEGLLRIALAQLIDNAWKFTARRESAHIWFGVEQHGDERVFFLRDDGAGFDSTLAAKLFGAFQRLHGVTDFEGHGIGLATVERIIRIHGGRVWARGEPDRGAVVSFTLGAAADRCSP